MSDYDPNFNNTKGHDDCGGFDRPKTKSELAPASGSVRLIGGRPAVRCPNPDCDPEEGCCICEHTGWVDANSEIFRPQNTDSTTAVRILK